MSAMHKAGRSDMFLTPQIRGAFFFLHKMRTTDADGKPLMTGPRYEFTGLVPKTTNDAATCPNYLMFAQAATKAYTSCTSWNGQWPAAVGSNTPNWPIKDGDAESENPAKYPWKRGNWIVKFSATETNPPTVQVLQNGQRVDVPAQVVGNMEVYKSGDFLHASASAYTYDNKSKGVKFDVKGVVFVGKGEAIGATRPTADQMFAGLPGVGVAAAAPGPAPVAAPPAYAPAPAPQYAPGPAPVAAPPAYPAPAAMVPPPAGLPPFPVPR